MYARLRFVLHMGRYIQKDNHHLSPIYCYTPLFPIQTPIPKEKKIDNFSSSVLGALSKCVFALHATISKFVYRVWRNTMYLGSHLDNKSLGEMDVIFWSILKVNVFTVFLKLKVLVARAEKVPHFLCYKKSVLIREQDAELARATDRPIVIQKNSLNFSICLTSQLRSI